DDLDVEHRHEGAECCPDHRHPGLERRDGNVFVVHRRSPASTAALVSMVGSTDMPERSRPASASSSNTIFTGMRCTILVKLPVALSGGSSANSRPLAGDRLSTWPLSVTSGKLSISISTGWPGRMRASCVSL